MNSNNDYLLNFCMKHNLVVVNSYFSYEQNGTRAWHRPGKVGGFDNITEHILLDNTKVL